MHKVKKLQWRWKPVLVWGFQVQFEELGFGHLVVPSLGKAYNGNHLRSFSMFQLDSAANDYSSMNIETHWLIKIIVSYQLRCATRAFICSHESCCWITSSILPWHILWPQRSIPSLAWWKRQMPSRRCHRVGRCKWIHRIGLGLAAVSVRRRTGEYWW